VYIQYIITEAVFFTIHIFFILVQTFVRITTTINDESRKSIPSHAKTRYG